MKNAYEIKGIEEMTYRLHALIYVNVCAYARNLRSENPGKTIRNATVIDAALKEFARRKRIILIKPRNGIPTWLWPREVNLCKRQNYSPIWMPTDQWISDDVKAVFVNGKVKWNQRLMQPTEKLRSLEREYRPGK